MKGIYKFNNITLNNLKKFSTKNSNIKIESLTSSKTPEAIGPYSKATKVDICNQNLLFCSGSLGVDYKTGELISENVKEQTIQSLENLKNLLEENDSSLDNVSKTTIFLADMNDFKTVNEIYAKYFVKTLPARSTVAVKTLPKSAKVEIECIAFSSKI